MPSTENILPVYAAMFTMTMMFNLRVQFLGGLKESSDVYEVSTKNSEVYVRVSVR